MILLSNVTFFIALFGKNKFGLFSPATSTPPDIPMNGRMSLPRTGSLEKPSLLQIPVERGDPESPQPRLHPSGSISSSSPAANGSGSCSGAVVPPPYSADGSAMNESPLELRGSLDCWACSVLVTAQNLVIATLNIALAGIVFGLILLPSLVMVIFGFLCHSKVQHQGGSLYCSDLLDDGGCVALLVVGFLLLAPLLVLALAAYCRMARHLQLGLCFIPYSRAVYKNLPASRHRGLGGCCGQQRAGENEGKGSVWV
ncbi:hypothetical protein DNTS_034638 [Danionella cerebrum]|uniref:Transmembrane protein 88 n=1 Tax=Danionella cerebrum TaxID=2873325 RepID=A0A553QKR5_9TELE|nr:hypothetical protein DNTS_034638 [Danionella translucida]